MHSHTVVENSHLLNYLRKAFPHIARTKLKHLLKSGTIIANGQVVTRHDHALRRGDEIRLERRPRETRVEFKFRLNFPIVYEDKAIIVIDKPAGLLTMGTDHIKIHTAYYKLTEYVKSISPNGKNRIFIVHRLDRDASGLVIFAKTEKAKEFLQKNWKKFEKKYFAVVEGTPKKMAGILSSYLIEDKFRRVYSTRKSDKSKWSITHYRVLESWGKFSLLEVSLETGRKNQIRVHLADLGHPIIGDEKYGSKLDTIRRLGLHAHHLLIEHPLTHEKQTFTSACPPNFSKKFLS